jgi:hypothetical protein
MTIYLFLEIRTGNQNITAKLCGDDNQVDTSSIYKVVCESRW